MGTLDTARPFSDADLMTTLRRAMRTVVVLGVVLFTICWIASGWRTGMLLLTGAGISLASLFEWRRLVGVISARMDNQRPAHSTSSVVTMFFLRLTVAGLILYGSLKCFYGSGYGPIYGLAAGLCLAFISLGFEALRMVIF